MVLVVFNTVLLLLFAASFFRSQTKRDWRVLGGFSAFAVGLSTEMDGFPLTIYLLSGPLGGWFPNSTSRTRRDTCGTTSSAGKATRTSAPSTSPATCC